MPNSAFLTREFIVMDDTDSPQSSNKRDLFPPEMGDPLNASDVEQRAAYGPPSQNVGWSQPQYASPWVRAPQYGDGLQQPPEISQPANGPPHPPAGFSPPFRQWSGTGWQYMAAGERPYQETPIDPQPGGGQQKQQQDDANEQKPGRVSQEQASENYRSSIMGER